MAQDEPRDRRQGRPRRRRLTQHPGWAIPLSDDQTFRAIWLISLLLMVLATSLPLVRSRRRGLRQAAIWLLIGGFVLAFYRIAQWLMA